jgi:hypothetical protein
LNRRLAVRKVNGEHSTYPDSASAGVFSGDVSVDVFKEDDDEITVRSTSDEKIDRASDGVTRIHTQSLRNLVYKLVDMWRVKFLHMVVLRWHR